jgi:hypothetical protein
LQDYLYDASTSKKQDSITSLITLIAQANVFCKLFSNRLNMCQPGQCERAERDHTHSRACQLALNKRTHTPGTNAPPCAAWNSLLCSSTRRLAFLWLTSTRLRARRLTARHVPEPEVLLLFPCVSHHTPTAVTTKHKVTPGNLALRPLPSRVHREKPLTLPLGFRNVDWARMKLQ